MSAKYEIEKVLVLSTAHITKTDNTILLRNKRSRNPDKLTVYHYEYGYSIYVGDVTDRIREASENGLSKEFQALLKLAHSLKCKYLDLDCDGLVMDNLPQFSW